MGNSVYSSSRSKSPSQLGGNTCRCKLWCDTFCSEGVMLGDHLLEVGPQLITHALSSR
jgi:hypothetical protein